LKFTHWLLLAKTILFLVAPLIELHEVVIVALAEEPVENGKGKDDVESGVVNL
jgi:hypothetical protein